MRQLSTILLEDGGDPTWREAHGRTLYAYCPGCKSLHPFNIEKPNRLGAMWQWNGDVNKPSFSPSLNYPGRCHSYLRSGEWQFLGDCTHELAGKTVPVPDYPL